MQKPAIPDLLPQFSPEFVCTPDIFRGPVLRFIRNNNPDNPAVPKKEPALSHQGKHRVMSCNERDLLFFLPKVRAHAAG
jgi:hypothetical protein